jgi:hypothetical protein
MLKLKFEFWGGTSFLVWLGCEVTLGEVRLGWIGLCILVGLGTFNWMGLGGVELAQAGLGKVTLCDVRLW